MSQIVPVRLSPELLAAVDRRAALESSTRSAVIRSALEAHVGATPSAGLSASNRERIAEISQRFGIERLEAFGSFARGEAGANDVDLMYTLKPGVRLGWDIEVLTAQLEDVFGRPVDLVARKDLHPRIREGALAEAQVLYAA